ncbi:MAG: NAD-dependent epimerase/dehydratase family protein [Clostridiales bacterium]|nr:NAD-dependent epimerase/dehydratase family protein [Clostridiales bacterium]
MKAIVVGGSGFIGSNIVKLLLDKNYDIKVIDDLSSGHLINIEKYIQSGDVEFVQGDIRDETLMQKEMQGGADVVFHLAACVGRQKSIDNPQLDSSTNLIGTINVLEGMRKNNIPRVVYSSSAAIFGELVTPTIDENHPQNADSPYGVSKLAAEKMILAYSGIYPELTGVCLRYFNIYGVNQRFDLYGNVIPIFAKRIYSGEPITIFGDGTQTRDFVNVRDVARANYLGSVSNLGTDVYNLGSGSSITINQLAKMMIKIAGSNTKIIYAPERPADVKHCKANADKAKEKLNFEAEVSLEKGLEEYMKWYKDNCL